MQQQSLIVYDKEGAAFDTTKWEYITDLGPMPLNCFMCDER